MPPGAPARVLFAAVASEPFKVTPRDGGGYVIEYPNGDMSIWPLTGEALRLERDQFARSLAELDALVLVDVEPT